MSFTSPRESGLSDCRAANDLNVTHQEGAQAVTQKLDSKAYRLRAACE